MRKLFGILFAAMMIMSLAACGKSEEANEPATAGQKLLADFKEKMESGQEYTAEELAAALIDHEIIPFEGMAVPVEAGYLNGFQEEITGFSEGACFGPMIGSIPFIGYVFYLEEGADVDAFVQNLKDQGDLRWNICTEADELVCDSYDNAVFFVMSPLDLEE